MENAPRRPLSLRVVSWAASGVSAVTSVVASAPLAMAVVGVLAACDPAYEPPPKAPASVYIPWNAGPARGARRAAGAPTTAPSLAPSVQLEEYDDAPAPTRASASASASAPPAP